MEISTDVIKAHGQLSDCSVKFLEYIKENPGTMKRSNYSRFNGYVISKETVVQPWPVFINKARRKDMEQAAVNVFNLIKTIPQRIFNHDPHKISHYYHMPVELVKLLLPGTQKGQLKGPIARGDFILSPRGFKCLEYNVTSNLGGLQVSIWEQIYLATPTIAHFLKKNKVKTVNKNIVHIFCTHLIDRALEMFPHTDEINSILVMQELQVDEIPPIVKYMNHVYRYLLKQKGQNLKGELLISNYNHLFEVKTDRLFFQGIRIHNLVEFYIQLAPREILNAYQAGNILLFNGPISYLLGSKLNLALLSEHQDSDLYSQQEKSNIEKYIPWSRLVKDGETTYEDRKIDLKDFMIANKDKLVLKPAYGLGGADISIGRYLRDDQWRGLIESALKNANTWENENREMKPIASLKNWKKGEKPVVGENKWVVQEYAKSSPYLFQSGEEGCAQHHIAWGLFVFGSVYTGGWVRLLPVTNQKGVINRHQGAEECVVFEVDE